MSLAETKDFVPTAVVKICKCGAALSVDSTGHDEFSTECADCQTNIHPANANSGAELNGFPSIPDSIGTNTPTTDLLDTDHRSKQRTHDRSPGTQRANEQSVRHFVPDQLIGKTLGSFQLVDRVGSGGMARVYLAIDSVLQREVAVKVVQNRKFLSDESVADQLLDEAIAQASLNHPHVVAIYSLGKDEGRPYLAMEHCAGGSLQTIIDGDGVDSSQVLEFALQTVSALVHAENRGLVHGDLKPGNLLLNDAGEIKLSDFGLARRSQDHSMQGKLVGTPAFMAPELFDRHPTDHQTDLYSFGVTLFQLLFGKDPYVIVGETANEFRTSLNSAQLRFPNTWPDDVPLSWRRILEKLLAKDRQERYSSFADLERDLQALEAPQYVDAALKPRALAYTIDSLFFVMLAIPFLLHLRGLANLGVTSFVSAVSGMALAFSPIALLFVNAFRRKSLGQDVVQLKTVRANRKPIDKEAFFVREAVRLSPAILLVTAAGLAVLGWSNTWMMVAGVAMLQVVLSFHCRWPRFRFDRFLVDRFFHSRVVIDQVVSVKRAMEHGLRSPMNSKSVMKRD